MPMSDLAKEALRRRFEATTSLLQQQNRTEELGTLWNISTHTENMATLETKQLGGTGGRNRTFDLLIHNQAL